MSIVEKFTKSFAKNPGTWVILVILAIAVHGNYTTGKRLTHLCELVQPVADIRTAEPEGESTDYLEQLIEENERLKTKESQERLFKEFKRFQSKETVEGRLWRWQTHQGAQIERFCAEREDNPMDDY